MKNRTQIMLLASALCAGVATPALADWDNIGSVFINQRPDRDSKQVRLGGSVERLSFKAESSDVTCRSISVRFANGQTRSIFNGTLYRDRRKDINLPGASRNINRIDFNCVAKERSGTKLAIAADIGNYRDEWRRNPEWSKVWSRMFAWANVNDRRDERWTLLGTKRFSGRNDRETVTGQRGINRIALRADHDTRCNYVRITFGNGTTRDVKNVRLTGNRYAELDLPGARRDVRNITLHCEGTRNRNVTVGVYGIRA